MQEVLTTILSVLGIVALLLVIAVLIRLWIFTNTLVKLRDFTRQLYNTKKEQLSKMGVVLTTLGIFDTFRRVVRSKKDGRMPR